MNKPRGPIGGVWPLKDGARIVLRFLKQGEQFAASTTGWYDTLQNALKKAQHKVDYERYLTADDWLAKHPPRMSPGIAGQDAWMMELELTPEENEFGEITP